MDFGDSSSESKPETIRKEASSSWVAVKELELNCCKNETLSFIIDYIPILW